MEKTLPIDGPLPIETPNELFRASAILRNEQVKQRFQELETAWRNRENR